MMAESKKTGEDLLNNEEDFDFSDVGVNTNGTPFDQTIDLLAATTGPRLELFCRSDKSIVEAIQICDNIVERFGSEYIRGVGDRILRFSISTQGRGRAELVDALKAGDGVQDSYYEAQAASSMGFSSD